MSKNFKELLGKVAVDQTSMERLEALFDEKEVYSFFKDRGYTGNMQNFKEDVMRLLKDLVKEQNVSDDELKKVAGGASKNLNKAAAAALSLLSLAGTAMPSAGATDVQAKVNQLTSKARNIASKNKNVIIPVGASAAAGVGGAGLGSLLLYLGMTKGLGYQKGGQKEMAIFMSTTCVTLSRIIEEANKNANEKEDKIEKDKIWSKAYADLVKAMKDIYKNNKFFFKDSTDIQDVVKPMVFNSKASLNHFEVLNNYVENFLEEVKPVLGKGILRYGLDNTTKPFDSNNNKWDAQKFIVSFAPKMVRMEDEPSNEIDDYLLEARCIALQDKISNSTDLKALTRDAVGSSSKGVLNELKSAKSANDIFKALTDGGNDSPDKVFLLGLGNGRRAIDLRRARKVLKAFIDENELGELVDLAHLNKAINSKEGTLITGLFDEKSEILAGTSNKFATGNLKDSDIKKTDVEAMSRILGSKDSFIYYVKFDNEKNVEKLNDSINELKNKLNRIAKSKSIQLDALDDWESNKESRTIDNLFIAVANTFEKPDKKLTYAEASDIIQLMYNDKEDIVNRVKAIKDNNGEGLENVEANEEANKELAEDDTVDKVNARLQNSAVQTKIREILDLSDDSDFNIAKEVGDVKDALKNLGSIKA